MNLSLWEKVFLRKTRIILHENLIADSFTQTSSGYTFADTCTTGLKAAES